MEGCKLTEAEQKKIAETLSRRDMEVSEIIRELKIDASDLYSALKTASEKGLAKCKQVKDPLRPFTSSVWELSAPHVLMPEKNDTEILPVYSGPLGAPKPDRFLSLHDAVKRIFSQAEREVSICSPFIDEFLLYLISASHSHRGLRMRILCRKGDKEEEITEILRQTLNAEIKMFDTTKAVRLHAKFMISDSSAVLVGSFNFTKHHAVANYDCGVYICGGKIPRAFRELFEVLWSAAQQ